MARSTATPRASIIERLYAVEALHRLVPQPIAVAAAYAKGTVDWLGSEPRRRRATAWAAQVLGASPEAPVVRRLARRALAENAIASELHWRRFDARRARWNGRERFVDAVLAGRLRSPVTSAR